LFYVELAGSEKAVHFRSTYMGIELGMQTVLWNLLLVTLSLLVMAGFLNHKSD
jgi:hypothetical protein